jgi:hypothetical protein
MVGQQRNRDVKEDVGRLPSEAAVWKFLVSVEDIENKKKLAPVVLPSFQVLLGPRVPCEILVSTSEFIDPRRLTCSCKYAATSTVYMQFCNPPEYCLHSMIRNTSLKKWRPHTF